MYSGTKKISECVWKRCIDTTRVLVYKNWFIKFRSDNFDIDDIARSGRSVESGKDKINDLTDANRRITVPKIAERLY